MGQGAVQLTGNEEGRPLQAGVGQGSGYRPREAQAASPPHLSPGLYLASLSV